MEQLKAHEAEVEAHPDSQVSLTDPDARSMMKAGGGSTVSYNVQTAVDSKHHLIAAHEVTNEPSDRSQLASMAGQAVAALDAKALTVIADPGYYKGEEIVDCYAAGIKALVPKIDTTGSKAKGRYSKADFRYDAEQNEYICPAGQRLTYRFDSVENGKTLWVYETNQCTSCPLQSKCTTSKAKRIKRWEKEDVLDAADALLKQTSGCDATAQAAGRTSLRHDQTLDGIDALFNETIAQCSGGDEFACAGLQYETGNQCSRRSEDHGTATGGLRGPSV